MDVKSFLGDDNRLEIGIGNCVRGKYLQWGVYQAGIKKIIGTYLPVWMNTVPG